MLGSLGRTYDEIADTLGFYGGITCSRGYHQKFGTMLADLNKQNGDNQKLYIANGMFITQDYCVRPQFQHFATKVYGTDVILVNFLSPVSKDIINSWVAEHTSGKVDNVLAESPQPNAKLVIVNTLYLNKEWHHHFNPEQTKRTLFRRSKIIPEENVMVDMMATVSDFPYVKSDKYGCHMVALPYKDGRTVFYAIMPLNSTNTPLETLISTIDTDMFETLVSQLETKSVTVALPKMNLNSKMDAKKLLTSIGISSLFSPHYADLTMLTTGQCESNVSDDLIFTRSGSTDEYENNKKKRDLKLINPGLFVDKMLHDVQINITETGTEAAAVTIAFAWKSRQALFRADEPFIFLIRDEETKLLLFTANIFRPTPFYNL